MKKPIGGPSCGNMPNQARRPCGAFSVASSAAPPHSPPSPTPWPKRSRHRSHGASDAGRGIAGQDADQRRRQAHDQHRRHQRRLAADAVAEMAEQERADRPRQEGDAEGQKGVQAPGLRGADWGRTSGRTPAPRRCRRCRNHRIRSPCRSGSPARCGRRRRARPCRPLLGTLSCPVFHPRGPIGRPTI